MTTTCFDKCTNASYLISNCILQLLCDSKIVYEINLSGLIIVDGVNSSLDIYSGTTFITNLSSDELAALGLTRAILEAERTACMLECPVVSKTVDVPNCAGTLVEKEVDSIVGAYILNQENKHTETVYDIVNAAIGGTITYTYTSPTNIALNLNTVTVTNDSLVGFWTDFGDGYNDFGNVPDHSYNADGSYEIKTYAILNSKNKILINAKEVIITNGVVAYAPTGTSSTINRPYRHVVNTALQNYCGNTPVDNPYLADGTSYTPTGTLGLHLDAIIDELEDNAEWNPENVADLVECVVGSANLVTEALDVNLGAIKEVVSPGSTLTTFHTLLGNNLDIQGDGLTYHMGAGINANISGSTYIGAQFTYTFNLIGEDDPGDPADFGITVWDNVAGTSVTATSITSTATYVGDAQGSGLNVPFYAWGAPGTYTIVWTGDLPVGDYTIGYMNQNFSPADHVELQVTHNLVDSMTTSKAQLVALDQCTINALTPARNPQVEIDLVKTNWLPICINGVQWFVAENSTIDNSSGSETTNVKVYKQGAYGPVTNTTPAGIATSKEGYCQTLKSCGAVGEVTTIPSKLLSNAEIDTIMFNLLGVNVPKQYANLPNTSFPQIINYQGTTGNIFYGYNIDTSKYACGTNVRANVTLLYTPLGDSDPVDTGLDIIFLGANPAYTTLNFIGAPNGTPFPPFPTKVATKLYPAIPASLQSIGATYDITGLSSFNILSYVQGINATDSVRIEGLAIEIISGDFTACQIALPVKDCNSTAILDALKQILNKQPNAVVANVLENASQNRITGVLALNSITAVNPTFAGARDVTVYNSKNVTVAFEYTTTVNGTLHRQNIPSNSTWSNTLKRDAYANEGTYTSGQIVTAYTAASAAGEINVNWTT